MSDKIKDQRSLIEKIEQEFDWNLITIISVWIFLLTTYFLIHVG
jgi:hypothetical protein